MINPNEQAELNAALEQAGEPACVSCNDQEGGCIRCTPLPEAQAMPEYEELCNYFDSLE